MNLENANDTGYKGIARKESKLKLINNTSAILLYSFASLKEKSNKLLQINLINNDDKNTNKNKLNIFKFIKYLIIFENLIIIIYFYYFK
tara:strand:+ start:57 stop:323 length:267 start_codon:yes stop_codon:yes gene_type:complete